MSDDLAATLLLHLRLHAFAPEASLGSVSGLPFDDVVVVLADYQARRWVQRRDDRVVGWTLTAEGRRHGQELLEAEMDAAGAREVVTSGYLEFLPLNAELLSICTDWQVVAVEGRHVPNDHSDPVRDAAVLDRLQLLHPRAEHLLASLADALDRFATYGPRLREAHDHVVEGDAEWLTRATGPSYHGTWFELHEHLLTVLDRGREDELVHANPPTTNGPDAGPATNGDDR